MNFLLLSLFCALIVQQSVAVSIGSSASSDSSTRSPCFIYCPGGYKVEYKNCTCIADEPITPSYIWSSTPLSVSPSDTRPSCGVNTCPTGYNMDEATCNCQLDPSSTDASITPSSTFDTPSWTKPCDKYCPYFFKIDEKTCTCILDIYISTHLDFYCPSGYEINYSKGRCFPITTPCNIFCPDGLYSYDYENCKCISNPSSPSPTMPTSSPSSTDKPSCLITCHVGQYLDTSRCVNCENCFCIPDPKYDPTLECMKPKSCPALTSWSIQECRCVCSGDLSCKDGYVIDENICKCVLEPIPNCAPGFNYSFEECSCVCANISTCPPHSIWDPMLCQCVCPLNETCSSGYVFDTDACRCVCEVVKNCANGFHFNDETCSCSCSKVTSCSEGFMWDDIICKCVEVVVPSCLPGFTYSPDHCDCLCTEKVQCTGLKFFDEILCKCICPLNAHCTYGHFNAQLCDCEFDQSPPTPPYPTPVPTVVSANTLINEIID